MIKYNDDNIYVGQIKELLHSFNLPLCKVKKEDCKFYVGEFYIDRELGGIYKVDTIDENKKLVHSERVDKYQFNDEVLNITHNLEIKSNYYDSYTHRYLGDYLRFLRDYYDINLMSMYNCFTNESVSNINIDIASRQLYENNNQNTEYLVEVNSNMGYNIYAIPVKSNTTYTLAFDCSYGFSVFCGFYSNDKYLFVSDNAPDNFDSIESRSFKMYNAEIRHTNPIIITTPELISENELRHECNLKLFIILPNTFVNNIVLLEGDYSKDAQLLLTEQGDVLANDGVAFIEEKFDKIDNLWYFNDVNTKISCETYPYVFKCEYNREIEKFDIIFSSELSNELPENSVRYLSDKKLDGFVYDFVTKHQLLEYSTQTKYLLADRLQEYLTSNVITHLDEIANNIKRVQIILAGFDEDFKFSNYGIWSESINKWIYRYISTHGNSGSLSFKDIYRDVLCFVDKDIESVLNSLVEKMNLSQEQYMELSEDAKKEYDKNKVRYDKALKVLNQLGGIYE